jgi:hypothetical protein
MVGLDAETTARRSTSLVPWVAAGAGDLRGLGCFRPPSLTSSNTLRWHCSRDGAADALRHSKATNLTLPRCAVNLIQAFEVWDGHAPQESPERILRRKV